MEEEHGGEHGAGTGWHHFVAGTAGGIALVLVGYPMDTIKVRLQTATSGVARPSVGRAVMSTLRNEGVLGFYRGVLSPLAGVPPQYALSFGSRGVASKLLERFDMNPKSQASIWLSGAISGFATTLVTTPVELVKARLQILHDRGGGGARDTWSALRAATAGGVRGCYVGFGITLLRDIPGSAIYYGAYEWAKMMLGGKDAGVGGTLLAGGFGGIAAWTCLFPVDLIKNRIQTHDPDAPRRSAWVVAREVVREGGVRALYRGLTASLIRAFPADAACFLAYEWALKGIKGAGL